MKNFKLLLLASLLAPWLTLPLIGRRDLKRFFPAGLFIALVVRAESTIAKKRVWWWFYKQLSPKIIGETPLIWGPFLVGSIWILKFTYGKFLLYMSINLAVDTFFVFKLLKWMKKAGIASLVRMNNYQLLFTFLIKSLVLYGFQYAWERRPRLQL
ncbi:MAG: hypothetical protein Q8906_08175 [Bacillota bacterium]|nr:hypothetical protein [Bacillota bacterium]